MIRKNRQLSTDTRSLGLVVPARRQETSDVWLTCRYKARSVPEARDGSSSQSAARRCSRTKTLKFASSQRRCNGGDTLHRALKKPLLNERASKFNPLKPVPANSSTVPRSPSNANCYRVLRPSSNLRLVVTKRSKPWSQESMTRHELAESQYKRDRVFLHSA